MTTEGVTQSFAYSLEDVDPACANGAGPAGNSCGIHIHAGTTCADNALGHYYSGIITSDPWTAVAYTSISGSTAGVLTVSTGGTAADVVGRAMIIHDFNGGRIACATLAPYPDGSDDDDDGNQGSTTDDITFDVAAVIGIGVGAGVAGCLLGAFFMWLLCCARGRSQTRGRPKPPKLVTTQNDVDPRQVAVDVHLHSQLKKNQA